MALDGEAERLALAWALGFAVTYAATPVAARVAVATDFLDRPGGHKGHAAATPYLGGAALLVGMVAAILALGGGDDRFLAVLGGAGALWVVGTLDDRTHVAPGVRLLVAVAGAGLLWAADLGWEAASAPVDLVLTLLWVGAVTIAFNLLDNIDGAAATTGAVAAAGIGTLAALEDDALLAALALGVCGSCVAFLRYNLASPARIFLGDGGSLPLGFAVAAAAMALPLESELGGAALLVAVPLAGVPLADAALVTVSRRRRGVPLHRGGRDHVTHRLLERLGSPRAVALAIGAVQAALCALAIAAAELGRAAAIAASAAYVVAAAVAIAMLETGAAGRRR